MVVQITKKELQKWGVLRSCALVSYDGDAEGILVGDRRRGVDGPVGLGPEAESGVASVEFPWLLASLPSVGVTTHTRGLGMLVTARTLFRPAEAINCQQYRFTPVAADVRRVTATTPTVAGSVARLHLRGTP